MTDMGTQFATTAIGADLGLSSGTTIRHRLQDEVSVRHQSLAMKRIFVLDLSQQVVDGMLQVEDQLVVAHEAFDVVSMAEEMQHLQDSL